MTEPSQPTPDDATLPGRAEVPRPAAADDATLPPAASRVQPHTSIVEPTGRERYAVGCEVARGGMGAILRATDLSIERTVAMKVALKEATADEETLRRFTQEAKLTGQLEHPNIVPVHDLSSDEQNRPFYTMKFVQGVTLHEILTNLKHGDPATVAQYSLTQLLTIFQKVCDAVAYAHANGVIHRDLKPANIMVGEYGEVLVMDWGLAKVVGGQRSEVSDQRSEVSSRPTPISDLPTSNSSQPALTLAGQIMGSPQYMAPEQAAGEVDKLDARTDIFALGGILYNILTLHPPVNGKTIPEMLQQILDGEILPPSSYHTKTKRKKSGTIKVGNKSFPQPPLIPLLHCPGGRIPESLGAVAMKALALRQEDRYQSVPELQKDIEAYQGGFATGAEKASAWRQAVLLMKRHKKEFGLAAVALGIIVTLVASFLVKVTKEKNRAEANEQRAETERDRAEKTLGQLHDTAPTFYDQAQMLIGRGQWSNAMVKASIAAALAPEMADYLVLYGNLLQTALRMIEARDTYSAALQRQPDHKVAQENRQLCETFLRNEDGQHPVRLSSLAPIQAAMLRQGRTTEAGAFTKFIHQAATDQVSAMKATAEAKAEAKKAWDGVVTAWSNVLAQAGLKGDLNSFTNQTLVFYHDYSQAYTNDSLAALQGMPFSKLSLYHCDNIRDLSPLAGMPLKMLTLECPQVTDLTPLRGMPLEELKIVGLSVTNLSPLQGMPLQKLNISLMPVTDLTPLTGMQLSKLLMTATKVGDLSPLRGMPLKALSISGTPVRDLSPLKGMPLEDLAVAEILATDFTPLQSLPLISLNLTKTKIDDLTPLKGLPLRILKLHRCPVTDLSPLRGMPLEDLDLFGCDKLQDLTPLIDCRQLIRLSIPKTCKNIEYLRSHPTLKQIGYLRGAKPADFLPAAGDYLPVAEFWKAYDAAKTNTPAAKPTKP